MIESHGLTPIEALGEFGLIDRITQKFPDPRPELRLGIGDDAALIRSGMGDLQVITTDLLLEGVHFDLAYAPLRHLGYKSVAVNVSDVVAMNAEPYGITVSIGMSNRFPVEALEELYGGIRLACEAYGINLLGGDTSSSKQGLILSVSAYGTVKESEVALRSGATEKELICVSGDLGAAYAGYQVLDREKAVFVDNPEMQPDLNDFDYVVGRQLKPEARLDVIRLLRDKGVTPKSMIDISDGLANELHHLARSSKVGMMIYSDKLPIDHQTVSVAEDFQIAATTYALHGGEDYELLFTIPIDQFSLIQQERGISVIGHVTGEKGIVQMTLSSGEVVDLPAQGWNHFSSEESTDSTESDA
ncbi:MAG: thiamine-phosphate kinase [Bacteroidota bacterium]